MRRISAALVLCAGVSTGVWGAEPGSWPQFRGPGGSGIAEAERPPVKIGPATNVKWKVVTPEGASSPIIAGGLVVITGFENKKLYTLAYDRATGKEAWRAEAPYEKLELYHVTEGSPAASTCVTDGERIVSYFGSCGLFCYDLAGKQLWKLPMPAASTMADFGTGVSPILVDGLVILLRDQTRDPRLMAVDVKTGKERWNVPRESISGFGTPVVWKTSAGTVLATPGMARMVGYDVATGAEKWRVNGMPAACCTTPVVQGDRLYFAGWSPGDPTDAEGFKMPTFDEILGADPDKDGIFSKAESASTPFKDFFDNNDSNKDGLITRKEWDEMLAFVAQSRNSAFALKAGGNGDITSSHVLWTKTKGLPYVPSAILYQGQFILVKDGGIVTVYDAVSGDEKMQRRLVASGEYYSSPVGANGHLYFCSLKEGVVTVVKADNGNLTSIGQSEPFEERISATPAIADNTLYLRTAGHLYAFAE